MHYFSKESVLWNRPQRLRREGSTHSLRRSCCGVQSTTEKVAHAGAVCLLLAWQCPQLF